MAKRSPRPAVPLEGRLGKSPLMKEQPSSGTAEETWLGEVSSADFHRSPQVSSADFLPVPHRSRWMVALASFQNS